MIALENEHLKVVISSKGAELQSLINKQSAMEYLWSGDEKYWAKRSPVLFPIVGGLKGGEYIYKNKKYALERHGFARDKEFNVGFHNATNAVFSLTFDEQTLKIYPFKFELILKYELIETKLVVSYVVINLEDDAMYFSLGAHPAFAVPNSPGTKFEDYYLAFNDDTSIAYHHLENGLLKNSAETLKLNGHKLPLKPALFYQDALVLKTLQSNCISLLNTKNDYGLHFHFENFPFFGIWSAKDAPFVCLEPWCGVTDLLSHNQQIEKKEGIVKLNAHEKWERYWEVECF